MKRIVFFLLCIFQTFVYSQDVKEKWMSFAFMELYSDSENLYTYYNPDKISEALLDLKGSVELTYNLTYKINRFSIGCGVGLTKFINPKFSSIKPNGDIKYFYVENKSHFFTLGYGYHVPFDRDHFREGHQIKLGQIFDLTSLIKHRLLLGFLYSYNFFYMENAKPLFSFDKPSSLKIHSFGISIGLKL